MTTTTDPAAGFLAAIRADPADDVSRLVYADWLDEHGQPGRAEFIRVQCELAGLPDCSHPGDLASSCRWCNDRDALRRRERELGSRHAIDWIPPAPAGWVAWRTDAARAGWWPTDLRGVARPEDHAVDFQFRRGFVAAVACTLAAWVGEPCGRCGGTASIGVWVAPGKQERDIVTCPACRGSGRTGGHGPALWRACPLEEVRLTDVEVVRLPHAGANEFWVVRDSGALPPGLSDLLQYPGWGHPTRQACLDALHRAALAWARQQPGP